MNQQSPNILMSYSGKLYDIPSDLEERFLHLIRKIEYAYNNPDYIELYRGTKIIFEGEFKHYESKS